MRRRPAGRWREDTSALQVVEVGGQDALNILREEWQTLQAQCPDATPFQTWEWNAAWWRHFGARKRPRLLLFRHAEEDGTPLLVGIAPLYTSRHLGTPLRRLAWIGTGHSDYLGPLARAEHQDAVACALRVHLDTRLRGWDIADLQQMRPDAPLLRQAAMQAAASDAPAPAKTDTSVGKKTTRRAQTGRAARQAAATQTVLPIEPCPFVTLPRDSGKRLRPAWAKKCAPIWAITTVCCKRLSRRGPVSI